MNVAKFAKLCAGLFFIIGVVVTYVAFFNWTLAYILTFAFGLNVSVIALYLLINGFPIAPDDNDLNSATSLSKSLNPVIWEEALSDDELETVHFEIYINGQKENRLLDGNEFLYWLSMHSIDPSSFDAFQIEIGIPIDVPEGTVRFVRQHS